MHLLQLKVVIWKNLIIRKRHWLLTIVESVLPILLFLLIAYGRSKIHGLNKEQITEVTYSEAYPMVYSQLDVSETRLYYTPNTEFYRDLMERVQIKFQIPTNNIKGFPSSDSLLRHYATNYNNTVIAVIFNGNDQKNLDYVLRIHEYYVENTNTAELFRNMNNFRPGQGTSYYHKGYLFIQNALDIAFIEKVSGKDMDQEVAISVQEFPYPPYVRDDGFNEMFLIYLPVITLFSFIFLCPAVLKRVVEEKYSGTKELLKMVGMKSWMLWLGWFIYGMIPILLSVICIVLLMKVSFFGTEYPPIEYTDGSILFVFLILYCMAAVVFCFAVSSFFSKPTIAMVAGMMIWILSYFVPKYGLGLEEMGTRLSWFLNMLLNLFPNMALHYGYLTISLYEERELGVQWNNFYKPSSGGTDDVTMLNVFVMLIIDIVFYMGFTMYMDGVNPGKYGVRKSVLFPIRSLIKLIRRPGTVEDQQGTEPLRANNVEECKGLVKGIEIQDVVKRYGHKVAVNNLTLNIYQDQITVLLGHNGAGKSTTMAMITGMVDVTSGTIKINGKDIRTNMDEIRKDLGLCPQHNLMFTDLTVGEHLLFFAKLKGRTAQEAEEEMEELLEKLHLTKKKNDMACTLSGGMKRKLCLGMAIIGGSKVLILDEPTSGMDPESRRELWDLLLKWRGEKTILITTHFMEEADALGDWIAIMANGKRQCHGTPMYLKKAYDTGYHLSLMVEDEATVEEKNKIKDRIRKHIDKAELKDTNGNNMVFLLPLEDNPKIAELLEYLEDNKEALKIENISVTVTTLEDVFLKAKLEHDADSNKVPQVNTDDNLSTTSSTKDLLLMRTTALLEKKVQFCKKKYWSYLIPALIAMVFFILTIYLSGNAIGKYGDNGPEFKLQLDAYKRTKAFYNGTAQNDLVQKMKNSFKTTVENSRGQAEDVMDVQQKIIDVGIENIVFYKEHLIVSAEFNSQNGIKATALYNGIAVHSAPISLNLITNSLAKAYLGENYSIKASYWPLETISAHSTQSVSDTTKVKFLWSIFIPIGFLLMVGSFMVFPFIELSTNFTQLQYMCGVKPYWYWLDNYVFDLTVFMVLSTILGTVAFAAPFIGAKEYGVLLLMFLLYGAANIPFVYLFSRKKSASAGFAAFIITGIFFGIILTILVEFLIFSGDEYYVQLGQGLKILFILVLPQIGLVDSMMVFCGHAVTNYNMDVMPRVKFIADCMSKPNPCCAGKTPECTEFESYSPLLAENMAIMFASSILYILINILLDTYKIKEYYSKAQYGVSRIWYSFVKGKRYDVISTDPESNPNETSDQFNTLKAKNLRKTYSGRQIVKNVGFTLKEKECLGILGVNGAGKTTTFRMLTRDEVVDSGNVEIIGKDNKSIAINSDEYLQNLGYCPQFDALNFVLTGKQILTVIGKLRGVNDPQVVETYLRLFELEEYADIPCGYYSGGNKRKLSLAVSLIGCPRFVLLDEPTNGVDPSCRRKFWNLIKAFKEKKDLSFVLTSHSMVECEALCNNLKIMKDGLFEREGTISQLKKEHGGFNIKLKLINKGPVKEETCNKEELIKFNNVNEREPNKELQRSNSQDSDEGYDEVDSTQELKPVVVSEHIELGSMEELKNLAQDDTFKFESIEELKKYFEVRHKGAVKDQHSGLLHIYIADKDKKWSTLFGEVEKIKESNKHLIEDYAISEASLEDIFLTVARSGKAEEETKPKKKRKKNRKIETGSKTV